MRSAPQRLVVLGHPIGHSRSPQLHNAAIRAAGIHAHYEAVDVPQGRLAEVVAELRAQGAGGNVTIPHKRAMTALCDTLSESAKRTGVVNTFVMRNGVLCGYNTDVEGFSRAVQTLLGRRPAGERVALLGAGGAAAAVLAAVELWEDSEVRVFNRTASASADLVASFSSIATHCNEPAPAMARATLVVNATSVGLADIATPVDPALLPGSAAVLDLVYRPGETQFVREARGRGLNAADGREMLLEQGALAFVQWFGCEPNKTVMRHALEQAMITG
jgi:shikimate dehydrogenase